MDLSLIINKPMTKTKRKLLLKYFILWILLSALYFYITEPILNVLIPGLVDIGLWLTVEVIGLAALFLIFLLLTVKILRKKA